MVHFGLVYIQDFIFRIVFSDFIENSTAAYFQYSLGPDSDNVSLCHRHVLSKIARTCVYNFKFVKARGGN